MKLRIGNSQKQELRPFIKNLCYGFHHHLSALLLVVDIYKSSISFGNSI